MAVKVFQYGDRLLSYNAEDFTLSNGDKFSNVFPYDPVLLEELGLDNVRKVIAYFWRNRDELQRLGQSMLMAKFVDRRNDNPFYLSRGQLRYYVSHMLDDAPLKFYAYSRTGGRADSQFILTDVEQTQQSADHSAVVDIFNASYNCGRIEIIVDDYPFVRENIWNKFHNYTFKMDPINFGFFRRTDRCVYDEDNQEADMFGVELEFSSSVSVKELQYIVTDVEPKQRPFFIFKHDGSVTGRFQHKVELVTVPCTARYLRQEFKKFFKKLETLCAVKGRPLSDYFDTSFNLNNGIHIHVSRSSFVSDVHRRKFTSALQLQDKVSYDF